MIPTGVFKFSEFFEGIFSGLFSHEMERACDLKAAGCKLADRQNTTEDPSSDRRGGGWLVTNRHSYTCTLYQCTFN